MKGPILVYAEFQNNRVKRSTLEILTQFREIAKSSGDEIACAFTGETLPENLDQLKNYGAVKLYHITDSALKSQAGELHGKGMALIARNANASRVLFPQSVFSREVASFCAAELKCSMISNVIDAKFEGDKVTYVKSACSGKLLCDISEKGNGICVATVVPNAFQPSEAPAGSLEQVAVTGEIGTVNKEMTKLEAIVGNKKDITEETILIGGGRAMKGPEGFGILENLASVLEGGVAASRAAVDSGWMPHSQQIGQTGKTVSPNLYVACGISGAIQHLVGMTSSKCIIAINKDPDAPVFATADYGIVGDVFDVVPVLTEELKKIKE